MPGLTPASPDAHVVSGPWWPAAGHGVESTGETPMPGIELVSLHTARLLAIAVLSFIITLPAARAQEVGLDAEQHRALERVLIQLDVLDFLDPTDQIRARK